MPRARSVSRPPPVRWIAHAGLGINLAGGTPNRERLGLAVELGVDWAEIDVCATRDGILIVRHDIRLASATPVASVTYAEVLHEVPHTLTLDQAMEVLRGRVPVLIDIKSGAAAFPLGRWLRRRPPRDDLALCTQLVYVLHQMRRRVPRVARWLSIPDIGSHGREGTRRVIAALWRQRGLRDVAQLTAEIGRGVRALPRDPESALARLGRAPWRGDVAGRLRELATDTAASGLSVHHWLISPELCETARRLRLPVTAWTVNRAETARRVVGCGVDLITTDDVAGIRTALAGPRPAPAWAAEG